MCVGVCVPPISNHDTREVSGKGHLVKYTRKSHASVDECADS